MSAGLRPKRDPRGPRPVGKSVGARADSQRVRRRRRADKSDTAPSRGGSDTQSRRCQAPSRGLRWLKNISGEAKYIVQNFPPPTFILPPLSPSPTTPAFLALLYSDAERTLSLLHDLGAEINTQQPAEPNVAPLKGEARAAFKTLDKYDGDYSRLTDLARM